jgi:hypothetical protein
MCSLLNACPRSDTEHLASDTTSDVCADLIQAGTPGSKAGGIIIFVLFCMGFLLAGLWIVFNNVHRNDSRKAHWVVPTVEEEEEVQCNGDCLSNLSRWPCALTGTRGEADLLKDAVQGSLSSLHAAAHMSKANVGKLRARPRHQHCFTMFSCQTRCGCSQRVHSHF